MALNTKNNRNSKYNNNSNKKLDICSYCKYKGHKENTCFKKYPYLNPKNKSINTTKSINKTNKSIKSNKETILASFIDKKSNRNLNTIDFIL